MRTSSEASLRVGRKLQSIYQDQRLTRAEAAKRAGAKTNYRAKLDRDEAAASLETVKKIIKALGIKSSEFIQYTNRNFELTWRNNSSIDFSET